MTATASPADRERLAAALELAALVEESFPSSRFTDDQRRRYAADVVHLDAAEAAAAVAVLKRSGRQFAPTAGEVCREVARLQLGAPEWGEVKRQLVMRQEAIVAGRDAPIAWACPFDACDGGGFVFAEATNDAHDCECRPARTAAIRRADELHPLVREFIDKSYVTWGEIDAVGQGGRDAATIEAQMRRKWEAFADRAVETRAIAAVEGPPTLARLEQARDEDAPRRRADLVLAGARRKRQLEPVDFDEAMKRLAAESAPRE